MCGSVGRKRLSIGFPAFNPLIAKHSLQPYCGPGEWFPDRPVGFLISGRRGIGFAFIKKLTEGIRPSTATHLMRTIRGRTPPRSCRSVTEDCLGVFAMFFIAGYFDLYLIVLP